MPARDGATAATGGGNVIAGKYVVERVLGAGGMGIVYAARHVDLHELFAIKLMRVPDARDAEEGEISEGEAAATERFLREARACARLRGEHVARVHDVGRLEDGTPYMVMEHLEGVDLRKLFKSRRGALPVGELVEYVIQACEAVAEAHAAGIIHRDLKPSNLFLTRRPNGTACIKVLDFGISKQLGAGKGLEVTNTSDMVGSPFYMAPEQMRSGRSADPRSDIWSLGVVLYELSGGAPPFQGGSITEVCARVLQDRPAPLAARVPGVPPGFEQVVLRCLEKEPENRFQTVAELAAALRAVQAGYAPSAAAPLPSTAPPPLLAGAAAPPRDMPSSAAWGATGTTAAPAAGSWSRLRIGAVAFACALAGALGAVALGVLRGEGEPAPAQAPTAAAPAATNTATAAQDTGRSTTAEPSAGAEPSATAEPAAGAEPSASAEASSAAGRPVTTPAKVPVAPRPPATAAPRPRIVDYGDRQ